MALAVHSEAIPGSIPLWILKRPMPSNAARVRGRQHMALFVPYMEFANWDDLSSSSGPKCMGTLFQAVGSPFTGYMRDIRPDYDALTGKDAAGNLIDSAVRVGFITTGSMDVSGVAGVDDVDTQVRTKLEKCAERVRAPGAAKHLFATELIEDCQTWVLKFIQELAIAKIVGPDAPRNVQSNMNVRRPLLGTPNASTNEPAEPIVTSSVPSIDASTGGSSTVEASKSKRSDA